MATTPLRVQLATTQGFAKPFTNTPANLLVLVADAQTGQAVVGLKKSNFAVIQHFKVPGAVSGFSGIFSVHDVGTGAYQLQVKPKTGTWVHGEYLAEVTVTTSTQRGQAAGKLTVA